MANVYDIVIRPIITERSMASVADKKYVCEVAKDDGKIEIKLRVDLDYILFAHLQAVYVLYYRHGAVKLAEFENTVYFHALSRADMVEDDSVLYRINVHFPPPKEA